ncbi:MAG: VOC family protein [Sphingomonadales bacterium]
MSRNSTVVFQNAFIVNDIEAAVARWVRTMGIGPWVMLENISMANAMYKGQPTTMKLHAALAASGSIQMELIQPLHDHASVYRDYFPPGREGFHHIGVLTDDVARDVATYRKLGHGVVASGGNPDQTHIAYVDTWETGHCLVELIHADDNYKQMTRMLEEAAHAWDGTTMTVPRG